MAYFSLNWYHSFTNSVSSEQERVASPQVSSSTFGSLWEDTKQEWKTFGLRTWECFQGIPHLTRAFHHLILILINPLHHYNNIIYIKPYYLLSSFSFSFSSVLFCSLLFSSPLFLSPSETSQRLLVLIFEYRSCKGQAKIHRVDEQQKVFLFPMLTHTRSLSPLVLPLLMFSRYPIFPSCPHLLLSS